jgi:hypothetical protein
MTKDFDSMQFGRSFEDIRFVVLVGGGESASQARLLLSSLRSFGGALADCPFWVFRGGDRQLPEALAGFGGLSLFGLEPEEDLAGFPFAAKVSACALAEKLAAAQGVRTLVWMNTTCMVISPPELLRLEPPHGAALRPVHVRNVGSPSGSPPDAYWKSIYAATGESPADRWVDSFVDGRRLRPYYNTSVFSVNPALGLCAQWLEAFRILSTDREFLSGPCADEVHRIFLHQAILSALLSRILNARDLAALPPTYSYPLHLHAELPPGRRARRLDDLVVPVYEDYYGIREALGEIEAGKELRAWLEAATGM